LRVKEETGEEIAGFVRATRDFLQTQANALEVDFDWASYAGKRRHHPWYVLAARALSQAGYKVFMHGAMGHTEGRVYTEPTFSALQLPVVKDWDQVETAISETGLCFFPIAHMVPKIHRLIELRPLMGLRSPVHTLARLINPLNAQAVLQGIFHPAYNGIHQQAAAHLGFENTVIIRGEGGEFERNPETKLTLFQVRDGQEHTLDLPIIAQQRTVKPESLAHDDLLKFWQDDRHSPYALNAVLGTLQVALLTRHSELSPDQAWSKAEDIWQNRNR